jgi:hypothetical protein
MCFLFLTERHRDESLLSRMPRKGSKMGSFVRPSIASSVNQAGIGGGRYRKSLPEFEKTVGVLPNTRQRVANVAGVRIPTQLFLDVHYLPAASFRISAAISLLSPKGAWLWARTSAP